MLKKLLVLGALGAIAVGVAKKLQAGAAADGGGWQSSYDPAPAPATPAAPATAEDTAATAAAEASDDVPPPPVDIPPAKTDVDPLTDPLPEEEDA